MEITSKIVYIKTKNLFEQLISTIPKGLNPIVFIEDTKELWTCGTYFSIGYPKLIVSEQSGSVIVTLGDSEFTISTTGSGVSIRKGSGNTIIINGSSLTKIDTEDPLEWKDSKLYHKSSGVIAGNYGPTSNLTNTNTITVPNIIVNGTGHITNILDKTLVIRDYVEQLGATNTDENKSILLSYNKDNANDEVFQVRKGNGLTYNDARQLLTVGGSIDVKQSITIQQGDLVVDNGYIVGNLKGDVTGQAIPKIHLSNKPEYGGASKTLYGHVLLEDEIPETKPEASSDNTVTSNTGVIAKAASPLMVYNLKTYIDNKSIKVSGYDTTENKVDLSDNFSFGKDFQVAQKEVNIAWTEINS